MCFFFSSIQMTLNWKTNLTLNELKLVCHVACSFYCSLAHKIKNCYQPRLKCIFHKWIRSKLNCIVLEKMSQEKKERKKWRSYHIVARVRGSHELTFCWTGVPETDCIMLLWRDLSRAVKTTLSGSGSHCPHIKSFCVSITCFIYCEELLQVLISR